DCVAASTTRNCPLTISESAWYILLVVLVRVFQLPFFVVTAHPYLESRASSTAHTSPGVCAVSPAPAACCTPASQLLQSSRFRSRQRSVRVAVALSRAAQCRMREKGALPRLGVALHQDCQIFFQSC